MQTQNVSVFLGLEGGDATPATETVKSGGALAWLTRILRSIAEERGRRRAVQELRRLDNHVLADMGIYRDEIEHVVRHGRRGQ